MAINIYGACSGNSGSKYDIWINVKQNSQSIEDNKSNVTVKLFLKRNDGYSSSAYNLDESSNTVILKVGGKEKVNKRLTIDTRNNATVTLATWTGDVSHSDDGSLSLTISGSFTMGGSSLTGGSVSGRFNCSDIPRASTLTFSKTSLNPLESVSAAVASASSAFTHNIKWTFGDFSVTHALSAGVTRDVFTVPLSWAEELTKSCKGNISVAIATYKGSKRLGSKSYELKLIIPETEEFLPDFTLVANRIDNSVPADFEEYVKGKSQVKLDVSGVSLKHGAKVSSYTAKVGSASKTKLPATFDLTKAGEITISVTLKDSRGFSVTKSSKINVLKYSAPTVSVNRLYRCDENGNKTTSGTYLFCNLETDCSSLKGKNVTSVTYKYKKAEGGTYSSEIPISENTSILGEGEFLNNSSYVLAFRVTDSITKKTEFLEVFVASTDIPFNIRKGGKGASFGCYSERDKELTVAWDLNVKGDMFYESADITLSDFAGTKMGIARYIPCMEVVLLRLRFTAEKTISSGTNHIIATFTDRFPTLATPINVIVNNGVSNKCTGYIKADTGDIVINSQSDIKKDDYIYVSGFFFAYRSK